MLIEALTAILGEHHVEYDISAGVPVGENWISSVFRVNVLNPKAKHLFVKCIPTSKARKLVLQSEVFFQNEVKFYRNVLPVLMKFQQEKHVHKPFDSVPTIHYMSNDIIVMDDLKPYGYIIKNKRLPLDLPHACLLFKEIGRFHALSFAFKDQCPKRFYELKTSISETVFKSHESGKFVTILTRAWRAALKIARTYFHSEDLVVLELFFQNIVDKMSKLVTAQEPYSVILHGDLHMNNIMFHYSNELNTEHPDKLCLLDFQMTRYASPALDLSFVLMLVLSKFARENYQNKLLRIYHESLKEHIQVLGSDPDKAFPFCALEDEMKNYTVFGLAMALVAIPGTFGEKGTCVDLDSECASEEDTISLLCSSFDNMSDECQEIIAGLLKEAIVNGYFNSKIFV